MTIDNGEAVHWYQIWQGEQDFSALVLASHSLVSEGFFCFVIFIQKAEGRKTTPWIGTVSQLLLQLHVCSCDKCLHITKRQNGVSYLFSLLDHFKLFLRVLRERSYGEKPSLPYLVRSVKLNRHNLKFPRYEKLLKTFCWFRYLGTGISPLPQFKPLHRLPSAFYWILCIARLYGAKSACCRYHDPLKKSGDTTCFLFHFWNYRSHFVDIKCRLQKLPDYNTFPVKKIHWRQHSTVFAFFCVLIGRPI